MRQTSFELQPTCLHLSSLLGHNMTRLDLESIMSSLRMDFKKVGISIRTD